MKSHNPDQLYELLPQYIRARDVEQEYALRALLRVITRQVDVVEENIDQLYDNWFIETCADWVVPYIGELIGYEPIEVIDDPGISRSPARDQILIPRREVANTLRYRARKGTLAVLEDLAMDITGWVAAAVEFDGNKPVGGELAGKYATEVIRKAANIEVEAEEPNKGEWIINWSSEQSDSTKIGLFVWRKRCYPTTFSTPNYVEMHQGEYYSFSPLGNQMPLYTRYERHDGPPSLHNLPIPITHDLIEDNLEHYYGEGKSFCIYALEWPPKPPVRKRDVPDQSLEWIPIPLEDIVMGNLSELRKSNRPNFPQVTDKKDKIIVDPELGCFLFPAQPRLRPNRELRVTYYSGFNADIGGGEYQRPLSAHPEALLIRTSCANLKNALDEVVTKLQEGSNNHILVEITDSGFYLGGLPEIILQSGQTLQIRARNRCRPVIWIAEQSISLPDSLRVLAYPASCFILEGILIAGRGVHVDEPEKEIFLGEKQPARVIIRHSTLVPGWFLLPNTEPTNSEGASIELNNVFVTLLIQRSIVGSISVAQEDIPRVDPSEVIIEDSILDSTAEEEWAIYGEAVQPAYVRLTVRRSTVLGEVDVRELPLAENSIFRDKLTVHNRQGGILRYCCIQQNNPEDQGSPYSNTPRRFRCQTFAPNNSIFGNLKFELKEHYGTPDYCRLQDTRTGNPTVSHPVLEGGEYGGEMGVYYHLFDPVRKALLQKRLEEYLPIGIEAEVLFVTAENQVN